MKKLFSVILALAMIACFGLVSASAAALECGCEAEACVTAGACTVANCIENCTCTCDIHKTEEEPKDPPAEEEPTIMDALMALVSEFIAGELAIGDLITEIQAMMEENKLSIGDLLGALNFGELFEGLNFGELFENFNFGEILSNIFAAISNFFASIFGIFGGGIYGFIKRLLGIDFGINIWIKLAEKLAA